MIEWVKRSRAELAVAGIGWIAVTVMSLASAWRPLEQIEFDWLTILTAPTTSTSPLVIVRIDEDSFAELGLHWPWPRDLHARLIERLAEAGARVIAFDVVFAEPSSPDADQRFAAAIHKAGNVVLAATEKPTRTPYVDGLTRIDPLVSLLEAGAIAGLTDVRLDTDGVLRHVPVQVDSFWRAVLRVYERYTLVRLEAAPSESLIRYVAPHGFPSVSYYQALDPDAFLPPGTFKDRIVLIGLDAAASPTPQQADMFETPFLRASEELAAGVEIHANTINAALTNRLIAAGPLWSRLVLLLIGAALSLIGVRTWRPLRSALLAGGSSVGLAVLSVGAFATCNLWLPVAAPIAGLWLTYVGQEGVSFLKVQAYARFVRRVFGQYVSSEVVEFMLANPSRLVLGGERREVTFIFTDIAGFTPLTEQLDAPTLVSVIKEYFEGMGRIILAHHGTIERFTGDGLVTLFNAPVDQPDHAARAVTCALELDGFAQTFAVLQSARGVAFGVTRIGVSTGEVTVGNFGSSRRFCYTAMGDAINTASRLEGANKYFGSRICVSGATVSRCSGIVFRPIGEVLLKGKTKVIPVFGPVPETAASEPWVDAYRVAYERLKAGDPGTAAAFENVLAQNPCDSLAAFHLKRLCAGESGVRIELADK